jgi:hypothetical protein
MNGREAFAALLEGKKIQATSRDVSAREVIYHIAWGVMRRSIAGEDERPATDSEVADLFRQLWLCSGIWHTPTRKAKRTVTRYANLWEQCWGGYDDKNHAEVASVIDRDSLVATAVPYEVEIEEEVEL